jgi:predicted outer membrane repeat protein
LNSHSHVGRLLWILVLLGFLLLVPLRRAIAQTPAPIRVDSTQTTHHWGITYDGSGWGNAVGYLQEAIDNQLPGGPIWVKEGTYVPPTSAGFVIAKQLSLYGGFYGDELYLSDRHGSFAGTVLTGISAPATLHVVNIPLTVGSSSVVIDGFKITHGHADPGSGGGILCLGWHLDLANCFVEDNFAQIQGGGLYFDGTGTGSPALLFHDLRIKSCEFRSNFVDDLDGGAIYATHVQGKAVNTTFIQNSAARYGGAVFLGTMDPPDEFDFTNGVFWANAARSAAPQGRGGAIYLDSGYANTTVVNCTFADNNAADLNGGQVLFVSTFAQDRIYNSILYFNNYGTGGNPAIVGGAIAQYSDIQVPPGTTFSGIGNINSDPLFRRLSLGLLNLKFNPPTDVSPCLDRADYGRVPVDDLDVDGDGVGIGETIDVDLGMADRTVDLDDTYAPNMGAGSILFLDMGAYERP